MSFLNIFALYCACVFRNTQTILLSFSYLGQTLEKETTLIFLPLKENLGDSTFLSHKCQKSPRKIWEDYWTCIKIFKIHTSLIIISKRGLTLRIPGTKWCFRTIQFIKVDVDLQQLLAFEFFFLVILSQLLSEISFLPWANGFLIGHFAIIKGLNINKYFLYFEPSSEILSLFSSLFYYIRSSDWVHPLPKIHIRSCFICTVDLIQYI